MKGVHFNKKTLSISKIMSGKLYLDAANVHLCVHSLRHFVSLGSGSSKKTDLDPDPVKKTDLDPDPLYTNRPPEKLFSSL